MTIQVAQVTRRQVLAAAALSVTTTAPVWADDGAHEATVLRLADGRKLGYARYGSPGGIPVFYFHGLPGCRREAELIAPDAAQLGVELIAIDRPGIGRSSYQCGRAINDWPQEVLTVADHLGMQEHLLGVIGMSGGAPYAAACARWIPERLSHVAIVSGHAPMAGVHLCPPGNRDRAILAAARHPQLGRMAFQMVRRRLMRSPERTTRQLTQSWTDADRQLVFCDPRWKRLMIEEICESIRCGTEGVYTEVQLLSRCWGFRLCDITNVPVSIWQGGCDGLTPASMGRYFHHCIPGSQLFLDPPAGHITNLKGNIGAILSQFA